VTDTCIPNAPIKTRPPRRRSTRRQKLAIGATASKRHLVEDLARLGVNEWAVMRALMVMAQRGEVTERAEGRRVTRVH
jgi:DNA replication licensing factor MCM5